MSFYCHKESKNSKQNPTSFDLTKFGSKRSALCQNQSLFGRTVLVNGTVGFVRTHASLALNRRGDGVIGLDNFNRYYDIGLKKSRKALLDRAGVFVIEGDINDTLLLDNLFNLVQFMHVLHLAA